VTINIADDELVRLWHTAEPSRMIAFRLCVTNEWLRQKWDNLRQEGKIPDRRRNQPAKLSLSGDDYDGRPSTTTINSDYDPLLDLLCEHHNVERDPLATRDGRPDLVNLKRGKS
jgi:hypothetical protein